MRSRMVMISACSAGMSRLAVTTAWRIAAKRAIKAVESQVSFAGLSSVGDAAVSVGAIILARIPTVVYGAAGAILFESVIVD